jgi:hypothetical protein
MCAVAVATLFALSPPAWATNIPPGRIVSLIPSDDEVSQYVGLPVRRFYDTPQASPRPSDHLDQRDECRALLFADTTDAWGSDYVAFRHQYWNDPSDPNRILVGEAVGTFPGTGAARDRFDATYNQALFETCNHAQFHAASMQPGITAEVYDFKVNGEVIIWTLASKYYGEYTGYNEVFVAWHLANVMAISTVGQNGNPAQAVNRLTGHILDRVG